MSDLAFRFATEADLSAIVALLMDDDVGESREQGGDTLAPQYSKAFAEMAQRPGNRNLLAVQEGRIVGTLHLAYVPGLSRKGAKRAIVEAVRVASSCRGRTIGTAMLKRAIEIARQDGCALVQVTSDKRRKRAHLFYRRLGFEQSHEGFKLEL